MLWLDFNLNFEVKDEHESKVRYVKHDNLKDPNWDRTYNSQVKI